jgi:hypothetical protein
MFATGDLFEIPVRYLPQVELPATMQFVEREYGQVIAEPYVLSSVEPAMVLLGPGEFTVENLALDNGLLRGTLVNRVNGIAAPTLFARINRVVVRQVTVEQARPLDECGSARRFGVPVRIADLTDTGLSVELYVVGIDGPVSTFGYLRTDITAIERSLIETEERIRQMQQSATLHFASVSADFQRRLARQQERLDSFAEYASSLLFDNLLAGTRGSGSLEPDALADPAARSGFRRLLRVPDERTPDSDIVPAQHLTWAEVALASDGFVFGWYDLENDKAETFRWMGPVGILLNPQPSRPVARVEVTIGQVYGAFEPALGGCLDGEDAMVDILSVQDGFLARFALDKSKDPLLIRALRIESSVIGCPAQDYDGEDERMLSVAVTKVVFHYFE